MTHVDSPTILPGDVRDELESALPAPGGFPACFAFSMPKCGSTMLTNGVRSILEAEKIPGFHFPRFFRDRGIPPSTWLHFDLREYFVDGIVYYGFRDLPRHASVTDFVAERRSIFLVRDLRDALTSHYFSKAFEHPAPGGDGEFARRFRAEKIATRGRSIDEHVLELSPKMLRSWQIYMRTLPVGTDRARVFRYEDIVYSKLAFFRDVFRHFDLAVGEDSLLREIPKLDVFPEEENVRRRIRSVKPGNHVEKLQPDTIDRLNAELHVQLHENRYI